MAGLARPAAASAALALTVAAILAPVGAAAHAADPTSLSEHRPVPVRADAGVAYRLPASGPVRRAFDPPTVPFGPRHRGVDLDVRPGTDVRAAADGTVTHAGPIAGTTWVAIVHADGVVTSYGPVVGAAVVRGDRVRSGKAIGQLARGGHGDGDRDAGLHWGARLAGIYIDPMGLLPAAVPRPSLVGTGRWDGTDHAVQPYRPWEGSRSGGWTYAPSPPADRPGFAVPPNANHLIMLSGLGSSSETVLIDPIHLGYDLRSVTRFSYAGRTPVTGDPADPARDQLPFDGHDTAAGVDAAARRLAQQLRAQASREPGRAVDLVGHSMGGVVLLHYLAQYHDAYDTGLPPIGHVVTIASPLQGSDAAAFAQDVGSHTIAGPLASSLYDLVGRLQRGGPLVPLEAPAVGDLATGSPVMRELAAAWDAALRAGPAGPLAMGTRVLTIGGGGDHLVGASRTGVPRPRGGATLDPEAMRAPARPSSQPWADAPALEHRILPGGHQGVLTTEAVREVVWRFLAGEDVVPSPGRLAHLVSEKAGITLRLSGQLVRLHDLVWQPLRRGPLPSSTVRNPQPPPPPQDPPLPSVAGD